jgi:tetratricopeptide (TPR) repeat protein
MGPGVSGPAGSLAPPGGRDWAPLRGVNKFGAPKEGEEGYGVLDPDQPAPADGKGKAPRTWRRDRQRPTFARVYVGDGSSLELVSLQVTVTVEGPRACTVVDHIFRNPHNRQLEGTFEYPLPTGASPSYFAMFIGQTRETVPPRWGQRGNVPPLPANDLARLEPAQLVRQVSAADWGALREAHVVAKEKALETYEDTVRTRIDPALLEYAGGNTFSGRVFPIPPKGYNRVLIAYEELLPALAERVVYRYPLPDCKLTELQLSVQAKMAECQGATFRPDGAKKEEGGGQMVFHRTWTGNGPGGDATFAFTPAHSEVQAITGRQGDNGPRYLYARLRPDLKAEADKPFAENAVFLLDTSLSEHPDRFAVSMRLLRQILEKDPDVKRFNVLAFNVGAAWLEPKGWLPNTAEGRGQALDRLDGVVLEGATDLSCALDALAKPGFEIKPGTPVNVFLLSDGQITWGERGVGPLVTRFEERCHFLPRFHCYRTGLGAENLELFEALARRGGGVFNCFTEADVPAAARAHRHQCLQVERVSVVGDEVSDLLVAGRRAAVYPGGDLVVAARVNGTGTFRVVLEGTFQGKPWKREYPVEVAGSGELAPRAWAEIAVAALLELQDPKLDTLVTAYCQQFGIGSRVASFLVLENEADYKRLNLEAERGKTLTGDLALFLADAWRRLGQAVSPREGWDRALARLGNRLNATAGWNAERVKKLLAALPDPECELPAASLPGAIVRKADVPPAYLAARDKDRRQADTYLAEARRRADAKDAAGAVRVLSSIIEEYPERGDALRLVGYRLLDLGQPAEACRLFRQVQDSRPFEPHSYRDLARSLEESGHYGLAALQYEIVLAGTWHARFHDSIKEVAREEYVHMLREALTRGAASKPLAALLGNRLEELAGTQVQSDLRVTISWNTDATDVDLWVIEPDGFKVFYAQPRSPGGGVLSQDQTQGYGPERYHVGQARKGVYVVKVHYFAANPNLLAGETHVNVVIARHAGTPQEVVERHTVILKHQGEEVEVARIKF